MTRPRESRGTVPLMLGTHRARLLLIGLLVLSCIGLTLVGTLAALERFNGPSGLERARIDAFVHLRSGEDALLQNRLDVAERELVGAAFSFDEVLEVSPADRAAARARYITLDRLSQVARRAGRTPDFETRVERADAWAAEVMRRFPGDVAVALDRVTAANRLADLQTRKDAKGSRHGLVVAVRAVDDSLAARQDTDVVPVAELHAAVAETLRRAFSLLPAKRDDVPLHLEAVRHAEAAGLGFDAAPVFAWVIEAAVARSDAALVKSLDERMLVSVEARVKNAEPQAADELRRLASNRYMQAAARSERAGDLSGAEARYRRALVWRRAFGLTEEQQRDHGRAATALGTVLSASGRHEAAIDAHREGLLAVGGARGEARRTLLTALGNLAQALAREVAAEGTDGARLKEARALAARAAVLGESLAQERPQDDELGLAVVGAHLRWARLLRMEPSADRAAARAELEAARKALRPYARDKAAIELEAHLTSLEAELRQ